MIRTSQKLLPSQQDSKKKQMKRKEWEAKQSMEQDNKTGQEKNKMGHEIEEIFRANKIKRRESPAITKAEEIGKMKKGKGGKEKEEKKKNKVYSVDQSSESHAMRRRTADGLAIYSAEELGIGNQDAGSTPLCPFDCFCCF